MHDHQSDWKSIYSDLDDMNNVDDFDSSLMGKDSTRPLITSQQLNHAKSVFRQMKQKALKAVKGINDLKPKDRQVVNMKINDLFTRAEINLQDVDYSTQITDLIHKTEVQLHRIVVIEKFASQINLIITKLKSGSLTKDQLNAAIAEMNDINKYTRQDLVRAQTMSSLQNSYVSGKNSVNGALVKYVADSQINIGDQLKRMADKVHQDIETQPNLNVAAKYLAYRRIDTIKTDLLSNLMSSSNFAELRWVQQHGISQLKSILNDKDKVLENLTDFNKFVAKVKSMVAGFPQLATGVKLNIEQKIENQQKKVEMQVQQLHHDAHGSDFNSNEYYLVTVVIDGIVHACQRILSKQSMKMTSAQQDSLGKELQSTITEIRSEFEQSYLKASMEDNLAEGIKQLKAIIKKINQVVYKNQVHQFIDDINSHIDQLYELSDKDRSRLKARIKRISDKLLADRTGATVVSAKAQLYGFFKKQSHYMIQASMHRIFNNLYQQIQASHLPPDQVHRFLGQLMKIRHQNDVDYESKQILIKNVLSQSLVVDKNENLQRMTKLNENFHRQINSVDIASQLDDALRQNLIEFSQRINDADKLSVADHEEQQFEGLAYRKLYHLYAGTDSPQAEALRTAIVHSDQAHHQIDAAILDSQANELINAQISKNVNVYLYRLLSIHDADSLKKYVTKVVKSIQDEVSKAVGYLKDVYISQIDHQFKKIDYQLKAYSVVWSILDKADVIQANTVTRIKRSKTLLEIEYAKQLGYQKVNLLASQVVSHASHDRRDANRQINVLIKSIDVCLAQIDHKAGSVNYALLNRVLWIENVAKYHVNQCLSSDLSHNCQYYAQLLGRILRHSYLREWLISIKRAQMMIKNLTNVPASAKLQVLQSVQDLKLKTTSMLQKCDQADLPKVLRANNAKVDKLIVRSIYLDPVKKRARQNLTNLVSQIRSQINKSFGARSGKGLQSKVDLMSQNIDNLLRLNDDQKVKKIYNAKFKELKTFELKLTRKIQLNHFTAFTREFGKQLNSMKMLANREAQQSNETFNRYYHKTIYEISHASSITECQQSEREGRDTINKILVKDQTINDSKQHFYQAMALKIKQAKGQILSLKSLQKSDKHDSNKLLDQIQHQAYLNVKQSLSRNQMIDAETRCYKLIKQVIDKVSSASVLVAAIQSANDQISQSTLDKQQKNATLKQINQIIDEGLKSQFNKSQKSSRRRSSRHFTKNRNGINDLGASRTDRSHRKSNSLISSVVNVFKKIYGKFA